MSLKDIAFVKPHIELLLFLGSSVFAFLAVSTAVVSPESPVKFTVVFNVAISQLSYTIANLYVNCYFKRYLNCF